MSKHKTLAEKKRSQQHKQASGTTGGYAYTGIRVPNRKTETVKEDDLLVVEHAYIYKDLSRTLVLSAIFLGLLISLYLSMQSGKVQMPFGL